VKRHRGSMPIILTCPHDGTEAPPNVPLREEPIPPGSCINRNRFNTGRDRRTAEITQGVAQKILDLTGLSPYVVIARFSRAYIDANRPAVCAFTDPAAASYYDEYHNQVANYVTQILSQNGNRGLLFDIHGTPRENADVFLGTEQGTTLVNGITGADLFMDHGLRQLVRMRWSPREGYGYRVLPVRDIGESLGAVDGGYTVINYSSSMNIDCIQIEISRTIRNRYWRRRYLKTDLAVALINFVRRHAPF
jgi:hypothetical protein